MNKQRIPQRIGIIFLLITICATNIASGQQKNNSTTIDNLKTNEAFTVYARVTSYKDGDPDTNAGQTSTCTPIKDITDRGLKCIAVGEGITYLSVIVFYDAQGQKQVGVAMDTGGDVKSCKAAKELATKKGFDKHSREYNAPVIDIYAKCDLTNEWSNVTIIPYTGPDIVPKKDDKKEVVRQKILIRNQQLDLIEKKLAHFYPELASK